MKICNRVSVLLIILTFLFSFNVFAMPKKQYVDEPIRPTPETEVKYDDPEQTYRWTWLSDELCVQFDRGISKNKKHLQEMYDLGVLSSWRDGNGTIKKRDTYTGKWSQSEDGIWSFMFDDYTIPVGVTKIDNILYAFNGYGELREGCTYWRDKETLKTAADGLVVTDNVEFLKYLETEYLPECTSHE